MPPGRAAIGGPAADRSNVLRRAEAGPRRVGASTLARISITLACVSCFLTATPFTAGAAETGSAARGTAIEQSTQPIPASSRTAKPDLSLPEDAPPPIEASVAAVVAPQRSAPAELPPAPPESEPPPTTPGPAPVPTLLAAPPTGPIAPATAVTPTALPEVASWRQQVAAVLHPGPGREPDPSAVDAVFLALDDVIWPFHARLQESLYGDASETFAQRELLIELYALRSELFEWISPALFQDLTGLGSRGRRELRREFGYLATQLGLQVRAVTGGTGLLIAQLFESPLTALWRIAQIALAMLVFRGWRRWARTGLREMRSRLMAVTPQRPGNVPLARWLWYFDRIRNPIEWLALVVVASKLVQPPGYEEIADLVWTVLLWVLLARFAVLWIDAMVRRGVAGLRGEDSALRLRSLRLIAAWSVLLGLGVDLTSSYAGDGVIHTWVVRVWQMLSIPVVLLLIRWWREDVFEQLEEAAEQSARARTIASRRRGLWSYFAVVVGAVFLFWNAFTRQIIRRLSDFEWGRRVLVVLVRREVAKDGDAALVEGEEPIEEALRQRLVHRESALLEGPIAEQHDRLVRALEACRGGALVLLGERGSGKTTLLEEVAAKEAAIRVVTCPPGGFDALLGRLAEVFEIDAGDGFGERLNERLETLGVRVIALDDAHLLTRPLMGGQRDFDRLIALDAQLNEHVDWILAMDRRAWPYIALARGDKVLVHDTVEMPAWSEEQLGELLTTRCRAADLEPDYSRLVLPRQLDASEHDSLSERNRQGYCRVLWEMADGNPEVAVRLFADSLKRTARGTVAVRLPQPLISLSLESSVTTLLILRVIIQCDRASVDDIAKSLRFSRARVESELRFCYQNGWLEEEDELHRVRTRWFRSVTRALVRKNLMPR